ncbi:DUF2069 domain-containing protein [Bermanella sp. R86510]|uniref:DUF2069 domain-containing protein n=1 Tax=unclassified Bermanella TaxID=2627862 RepID=UPI0037C539A9
MIISYRIAIICFFVQFIILGVGSFTQPGIEIATAYDVFLGIVWTLIKGIPWLVLVPGLIKNTRNIMAWMSYVCLVYFIIWILAAFGDQQNYLGTIGVLVTLVQFIAAALYTRLSKRQEQQ